MTNPAPGAVLESLDHRNARSRWCVVVRTTPVVIVVQRFTDRGLTKRAGRPVGIQRPAARHALRAAERQRGTAAPEKR